MEVSGRKTDWNKRAGAVLLSPLVVSGCTHSVWLLVEAAMAAQEGITAGRENKRRVFIFTSRLSYKLHVSLSASCVFTSRSWTARLSFAVFDNASPFLSWPQHTKLLICASLQIYQFVLSDYFQFSCLSSVRLPVWSFTSPPPPLPFMSPLLNCASSALRLLCWLIFFHCCLLVVKCNRFKPTRSRYNFVHCLLCLNLCVRDGLFVQNSFVYLRHLLNRCFMPLWLRLHC